MKYLLQKYEIITHSVVILGGGSPTRELSSNNQSTSSNNATILMVMLPSMNGGLGGDENVATDGATVSDIGSR